MPTTKAATEGDLRAALERKLRPSNFTAMSPRMAALVAAVVSPESWGTTPRIERLAITSDGCLLAQHEGDCGFNSFIGAHSDFRRNVDRLLLVAGLTTEEHVEFHERLTKITESHTEAC